jgi:hypothetical protein
MPFIGGAKIDKQKRDKAVEGEAGFGPAPSHVSEFGRIRSRFFCL